MYTTVTIPTVKHHGQPMVCIYMPLHNLDLGHWLHSSYSFSSHKCGTWCM